MTSIFHGDIKKRYIEILRKEFKDQALFEEINIFLKKKIGASDAEAVVLPKEIEPPSSITAFYASDINQLSYDSKESPNSIFTYY